MRRPTTAYFAGPPEQRFQRMYGRQEAHHVRLDRRTWAFSTVVLLALILARLLLT